MNSHTVLFACAAEVFDGKSQNFEFIRDTISYNEICRFFAMTAREKRGQEDMVLCDKCPSMVSLLVCWYCTSAF